jgi:hypothetical protein
MNHWQQPKIMVAMILLLSWLWVAVPVAATKNCQARLPFVDSSKRLLPQAPSFLFVLVHEIPRGGDDVNSDNNDDDDEDGYDDDEEEYDYNDDDDDKEDPRRQDPRQQRPDPYDHRMARPPAPRRRSKQQQQPQHWSQRLASQSLQMGGQLAWNAVKQPGKVAYHLIRPKHVDAFELGGLWRLDQQITSPKCLASVATVELDPKRKRVILNNGKEIVPYTFTKSKMLGSSFQTEFIARAFLMGDTPRLYGYRGTWQRKLADTNVIKLVGKIYKVRKPRFGNGPYQFVGAPVGTFVARRRVQLLDDDEEDEYDDEYDAGGEYDNDEEELEEEEGHFEEDEENNSSEDDEDDIEEAER